MFAFVIMPPKSSCVHDGMYLVLIFSSLFLMFFGVFYITAMSLVPGHVNYKGPRHSGSTSHCSNHHIYNLRLSHFIHYSSSYFYHSRYLAPDLKYFHYSLFGGGGRMYRNSCAIF